MLLDIVKKIVSEQGEQILSDPKRVNAFFSDLAKDEPKPQKQAFIKSLEHGYVKILKEVSKKELDNCKENLANRLCDEEGLKIELCRETIDILCIALFGEINLEIKKLTEDSHKLSLQIDDLKTKLVGKEKELAEKKIEYDKLHRINKTKEMELKEKDSEIERKSSEVERLSEILIKKGRQAKILSFIIIILIVLSFILYKKHVYSYFNDPRDGQKYKIVKIGNQVWMAENLSYNASGSLCYGNNPKNCNKYGRLYNWNTALKACPSGWHLPTNEELGELIKTVGGKETAGKHLKAKSGWNDYEGKLGNGLDSYSFAALPGGFGYSGGSFISVGYHGNWWSASEYNAGNAYCRNMGYDYEGANYNNYNKSYLFSVRCLQDVWNF